LLGALFIWNELARFLEHLSGIQEDDMGTFLFATRSLIATTALILIMGPAAHAQSQVDDGSGAAMDSIYDESDYRDAVREIPGLEKKFAQKKAEIEAAEKKKLAVGKIQILKNQLQDIFMELNEKKDIVKYEAPPEKKARPGVAVASGSKPRGVTTQKREPLTLSQDVIDRAEVERHMQAPRRKAAN
jgi:hypothetical protein